MGNSGRGCGGPIIDAYNSPDGPLTLRRMRRGIRNKEAMCYVLCTSRDHKALGLIYSEIRE